MDATWACAKAMSCVWAHSMQPGMLQNWETLLRLSAHRHPGPRLHSVRLYRMYSAVQALTGVQCYMRQGTMAAEGEWRRHPQSAPAGTTPAC